jgi:D-alanine transaminase
VLYTPALELGILAGVTRATLLEEAGAAGVRGAGRRLPARPRGRGERGLHVLVIREVMPVVELDGKAIGDGAPGPAARELQEALRRAALR